MTDPIMALRALLETSADTALLREQDSAQGIGVSCPGGARPPAEVLPITPSTYHAPRRNGLIPARPRQERDGMRCCGHGSNRCSRRILHRLRRAQGPAAARPRRHGRRPLRCGAADAASRGRATHNPTEGTGTRGVTQTEQPPTNRGRFVQRLADGANKPLASQDLGAVALDATTMLQDVVG